MRRHIISVLIIFSLMFSCLGTAGCHVEEEEFPELDFPEESVESQPSSDDDSNQTSAELQELTVALPLSDETVTLLMKLYYAKNNDLFPAEMTGADISLEYLDAINTPWVINTVTTASTGETADNLTTLSTDGIEPDLLLAGDINDLIEQGTIIPLDEFLFNDSSLSSYSIYLDALESLRYGDDHYGLPFYSSVYMLAGSTEFLPESGVPPFSMGSDELLSYVHSIPSYNNDGTYITRFYYSDSISELLGEDFADSLEYDGLTSSTDSYGADPRVSRTCGVWVMNSSEFDTWSSYYPDGLYFTMLPAGNVNAVVYPICVSSTCTDPEFAADFAAFICFDKDAQMLMRRLEALRGFFPPITTRGVWDEISTDPDFGAQSMLYEQYLTSAIYDVAGD